MRLTENKIVTACLEYLHYRGHFVWRNNTGAVSRAYITKKGVHKTSFWRAGIKGSSDIVGIAKDGKMIAVECKMPGKHATRAQKDFLGKVETRGGYAIVARSILDLEEYNL